ncbi:uncharacterized protein LOC130783768 [Actinidia eriantha]|uniref:uncharacterized protein LOC130783768 n=1 Tax=Actinidia eriantha TaxID=165200 RepID=UPI00258A5AF9|nr:uncharacterized protein LOC130783768 [Actinidia eriantha]
MLSSSSSSSRDLPQDALHHKSFSRLVSNEGPNMASPSFRVLYYGGVSGSVPFLWESQPGTPKHSFSDTYSLPPLTPPPSYFFNNYKIPTKKHSRSKLLHTLFLRINLKKIHVPQSPSSSSSLSSSSSSSSSNSNGRSRFSSSGSSFDDSVDGEVVAMNGSSPTSTLCFGIGNRALLAMVGRGSG